MVFESAVLPSNPISTLLAVIEGLNGHCFMLPLCHARVLRRRLAQKAKRMSSVQLQQTSKGRRFVLPYLHMKFPIHASHLMLLQGTAPGQVIVQKEKVLVGRPHMSIAATQHPNADSATALAPG